MRNTGPITVTKLHPLFGAEVSGIDITRPLSAREFGPIRAAFEEHSVLLFRDQPMDDEKQIAVQREFRPARDHRQLQSRRRHQVPAPVQPRHHDRRADPARRHAHDLPEGQLLLALRLLVQARALAVLDPDRAHLPARGRQHRVPVHARGVGRAAAGAAGDDPAAGRRARAALFAQPRAEGHPERQGDRRAAAGQAAAVSATTRSTAAARSISAPMPATSSAGPRRPARRCSTSSRSAPTSRSSGCRMPGARAT